MSSAPLWSIDRQMTRQISQPSEGSSSSSAAPLWDATPIGKSLVLRLCQREQLSPQLILEDKVFRSAIRLQHGSTYRSQMQFVGTLILDEESQRLTYVIDRLQVTEADLTHQQLNGEFLIPIRCDQKTGNLNSSLMQEGIKVRGDEWLERWNVPCLGHRCVLSFVVADRTASVLFASRTNALAFGSVDQCRSFLRSLDDQEQLQINSDSERFGADPSHGSAEESQFDDGQWRLHQSAALRLLRSRSTVEK